MDKASHSVKRNESVEGAIRQLLIDLNEIPEEEVTVDLDEPPKLEVLAPLDLFVDLRIRKADMEFFKQKNMPVAPSSAAFSDGSKDLRFDSRYQNVMFIRDKRVQFKGKSLYALGRSWFKEGLTEKNKAQYVSRVKSFPKTTPASMVEGRKKGVKVNKNKKNDEDAKYAKKLLREFIRKAKVRARARDAKKKGKAKVRVVRPACFIFPTRARTTKYKPFPKLKSFNL